jgi:hypothetical protein
MCALCGAVKLVGEKKVQQRIALRRASITTVLGLGLNDARPAG